MDGPAFVTQCPITPGNAFLLVLIPAPTLITEFAFFVFTGIILLLQDNLGRTGTILTCLHSTAMDFGKLS